MDKYEKALEQARNYYPDNQFLDMIFPELAESEDERIRRFLKDYAIEMIAGLESDISISVYDGVKGHDPDAEEELEKWRGARAWLEKQKEQQPVITHGELYHTDTIGTQQVIAGKMPKKPAMIQWTGNNLKEVVDFTGKSPRFNEWFKTWEEFEAYVHSHGDVFKIFKDDGSHYEVPIGAWIVRTPDGYNVASRSTFKQKPAEWSYEDKNAVNNLVAICTAAKTYRRFAGCRPEEITELQNWLKDLEQMK